MKFKNLWQINLFMSITFVRYKINIYKIWRGLAVQEGDEVFGGHAGHPTPRLERGAGDVRKKDDVLQGEQTGMQERLMFIDVQSRRTNRSFL